MPIISNLVGATFFSLTMHFGAATQVPNCDTAPYHQFDFWVGEWDVYLPQGDEPIGRNIITKEENGCLIVERWTSAQGPTGQSYNYLNPATGQWRQVWVSSHFTIDYGGGLDESGAMALEGAIQYRANGTEFPFRGVWTPHEDGSLTQSFEQYNPETEEWTSWFVGLYRPAS